VDARARFVAACRERGVGLVHAHFGPDGIGALELARDLGVPLAVTFHGFDATLTDAALTAAGFGDYVRRRAELFASAARLIAVSQFIADQLIAQGALADKVLVHHIGVPLGPPPEPTARRPEVLFVGRHVEKKGLADLIAAMERVQATVPDARLVAVGDGPLRAQLEAQARGRLRGVEFTGWLTSGQVGERMQAARALCVPSRRASDGDAEGLGQVILEAAARGLPTVATRHGGIPEAVGPGGLLAPEGDVEALAARLTELLTDGERWRALAVAARAHAERDFDLETQTARLEAIYDELLSPTSTTTIVR
jgi:glycosyltransferase involved in cell wall biosynthesis